MYKCQKSSNDQSQEFAVTVKHNERCSKMVNTLKNPFLKSNRLEFTGYTPEVILNIDTSIDQY